MTTFIYALKEPDTGEIRYIGKADNLKERLRTHLAEAKTTQRSDYKNNWLRSLSSEPLLEVIDEVPFEHWQQLEVAYIEFFREQGCRLVNTCPGGEGIVFTQEIRDKIGNANRGKKYFGEANPFFGKTHTTETRKIISEKQIGRKASSETLERMSKSHMGNKSNSGMKLSPEHKLAISLGLEKYWSKKKAGLI